MGIYFYFECVYLESACFSLAHSPSFPIAYSWSLLGPIWPLKIFEFAAPVLLESFSTDRVTRVKAIIATRVLRFQFNQSIFHPLKCLA